MCYWSDKQIQDWIDLSGILYPTACGVVCPRCGAGIGPDFESDRLCFIATSNGKDKNQCLDCGYMFSIIAGSPFHGSRLPYHKIVQAIGIIKENPRITGHALKKSISVSYKTAWSLKKRILKLRAAHS